MPEKSDKELAVELTSIWVNAFKDYEDSRAGKPLVSVDNVRTAYEQFLKTVSKN